MSSKFKIVLASTSPRRASLLDQIGLDYVVLEPIEEEDSNHFNPREKVMENAVKKALSVRELTNALVLAADTLVYINGELLGKPVSEEDARSMLKKLSGNIHFVFTGVAILNSNTGETITSSEKTLVQMKSLSNKDIEDYIAKGEPMGKAGAYAIQGLGAVFIDRVDGCFHNVIGLPLSLVWDMFNKMEINLFDFLK